MLLMLIKLFKELFKVTLLANSLEIDNKRREKENGKKNGMRLEYGALYEDRAAERFDGCCCNQ